jgi:hypothetical protein
MRVGIECCFVGWSHRKAVFLSFQSNTRLCWRIARKNCRCHRKPCNFQVGRRVCTFRCFSIHILLFWVYLCNLCKLVRRHRKPCNFQVDRRVCTLRCFSIHILLVWVHLCNLRRLVKVLDWLFRFALVGMRLAMRYRPRNRSLPDSLSVHWVGCFGSICL